MQKKAIRRIFNTQCNEHANDYFIELNGLRQFDLLKYESGLHMYEVNKKIHNCLYIYIYNLFIRMAVSTLYKLGISNSLMKEQPKN